MLDPILQQILSTHWIEWLGTITGIIGVTLSIHERITAWPLFILCYASYVYLSFEAALYAALAMNIVFIAISLYGWRQWSKHASTQDAPTIQRAPKKILLRIALLIPCGALLFGSLLQNYTTDAYFPYLDAFAMSAAFAAQWMLSKKYIHNWLCWMTADIIYVTLWSSQDYWVSAGLFAIFIGLATKGWFKWRAQIHDNSNTVLPPNNTTSTASAVTLGDQP